MRSPGKLLERRIRNAAPPVPVRTQAGAPTSAFRGLTGGSNDPGKQLDLYRQVSPLNAGVNLLAQSFSMVPWHLYRTHDYRGRISGPDARREVFEHQALNVWNQPNEIMPGQFFREMFGLHLELTGHSFWVMSSLGGIPAEMWPISKRDMEAIPSSDERYAIAGYVYYGPNGQAIPLQRDEVVWVRTPDPTDTFGGGTALQAMTTELESQRATSEWKRNYFKNSAEPGGIWELDLPEGMTLSDEEFNTLSERWAEQHRGVRAAHRVAILERGKWIRNDNSLKDMQFVQLRQDDRDAVYEGLGVSKSLLGVTEDVNRANAETNEYVFAKYRTSLRCERVKSALNGPYLRMFGATSTGVGFDYDSPVPADWRSEAQALREKLQGVGWVVRYGGATLESAAQTVGLETLQPVDANLVSAEFKKGTMEGGDA
jgi:HK97 family phage portal protein